MKSIIVITSSTIIISRMVKALAGFLSLEQVAGVWERAGLFIIGRSPFTIPIGKNRAGLPVFGVFTYYV